MPKEQKMTIEDLARMVAKGFNETGKDLGSVKQDLGLVKQDLGLVKKDLSLLRDDVDSIGEDVKYLKGRTDLIELELRDIKTKLENVVYRHEFEMLKSRIGSIEERVGIKR